MVELTLKLRPTQTEINQVIRGLVAHNKASHLAPVEYMPVGIFTTDQSTGKITGGLTGHAGYDWFFIQYLHLPAALRGQGIGTQLVRRLETWANDRGLIGLWVDTFEFQAKGFYEKQGFSVFGTLEDHPVGSRRYFLQKRFGA